MQTKITHNKTQPDAKTLLAGGRITFIPRPGEPVTVICNGDNARIITGTEPEPIPMCEMQPGFGVIVGEQGTGPDRIGHAVVCHSRDVFFDLAAGTRLMTATSYTVRIIRPGESLLIEVEDDEDSAKGVTLGDYLADPDRPNCPRCKHKNRTREHDGCRVCCTDLLRPNFVGESTCEPETLDHALRHGEADAIVATLGSPADWDDVWVGLCRGEHALFGDLFDCVIERLRSRDTTCEADCRDFASEIADIRDRLGLFKEENNGK